MGAALACSGCAAKEHRYESAVQIVRKEVVELEGESRRVYFRFYDPRVMQTFADAITPEQRAELLQVLDAIHFEGDAGAVRTLARA